MGPVQFWYNRSISSENVASCSIAAASTAMQQLVSMLVASYAADHMVSYAAHHNPGSDAFCKPGRLGIVRFLSSIENPTECVASA